MQYVLRRIHETENEYMGLDYTRSSIEHLLPESSAGNQQSMNVLSLIGNLVIVPAKFNSEVLRDRPFVEKVQSLKELGYSLDPVLASATEWTEHEIRSRTAYLSEKARNVTWKVG